MVRAWFGITPPPRGQGYYPDEEGFTGAVITVPGHDFIAEYAKNYLRSKGYTVTKGENN